MGIKQFLWWWLLAYMGALTGFSARMAYKLFGIASAPPTDPAELAGWRRKRRWLMISEFAALPMFATLAVLSTAKGWTDPVTSVIAAMILGALGFAFLLHALETAADSFIRSRFPTPEDRS